jgi:hypothetical protein
MTRAAEAWPSCRTLRGVSYGKEAHADEVRGVRLRVLAWPRVPRVPEILPAVGVNMARKRRREVPIMLLWSRREQRRFAEVVERLESLLSSLATWTQELVAKVVEAAEASKRPRPKRGEPRGPMDHGT